MATKTGIEWTDYTSNPVRYRDLRTQMDVWFCVKHSPGCLNCYSEALALRFKKGGKFNKRELPHIETRFNLDEAREVLNGRKLAGKRVFVCDMTDAFGDWVPDDVLDQLSALFAIRSDVTFQLLTKRPERMAEYVTGVYRRGSIADAAAMKFDSYVWWNTVGHGRVGNEISGPEWPLPNVWLGTSVESQETADKRIPELLKVPARVRFLSCEPLLGPVNIRGHALGFEAGRVGDCQCGHGHGFTRCPNTGGVSLNCHVRGCPCPGFRRVPGVGLHWVIVGGESGPNARPMRIEWARSIVKQCKAAGVPVFCKQLGLKIIDRNDRVSHIPEDRCTWPDSLDIINSVEHDIHGFREEYQGADVLVQLNDKKGGDPNEWPEDLRVREFPEVA